MLYHVEKHYPHSLGLSAAFRQHRAESHCRFIHGYPLAFTYEFVAWDLDVRNWVIDFGSLKPIKKWLEDTFDHKLLVARDDPQRYTLLSLDKLDLADVVEVDAVGCEAFAKLAFEHCKEWLRTTAYCDRVQLIKVTCAEHTGNNASVSEPVIN
jgi:6-pyruvoyltetrahydropterin/6-carboxytetrahydropterin synthase